MTSRKPKKLNNSVMALPAKPARFGMDKILKGDSRESLTAWASIYFGVHVAGSSRKTELAKRRDLEKFLSFFQEGIGHDRVDAWTPSVSRHFQNFLTVSGRNGGEPLKATSVNRTMATVRHFGRWLHKQRPLLAGDPLAGVKDLVVDPPDWSGLTDVQILRLKAACDQRLRLCARMNQSPGLEAAVFFVLLHTGLRAGELAALDLSQYHHRGFHDVLRKGKRVSKKVPLPGEARKWLDSYIEDERGREPGALLLGRYGDRITAQGVALICSRIARQASAHLSEEERVKLTPHMLRHSFLKRVADKHGVHYAQRLSGNISIREVFRYTKPSDEEVAGDMESLFG